MSKKQSLAIAMNVQRMAKKKEKFKDGGEVKMPPDSIKIFEGSVRKAFGSSPSPKESPKPRGYARGGMVDSEDDMDNMSIADIIRAKSKSQEDNGQVDLLENAENEEAGPLMWDPEAPEHTAALQEALDDSDDNKDNERETLASRIRARMKARMAGVR